MSIADSISSINRVIRLSQIEESLLRETMQICENQTHSINERLRSRGQTWKGALNLKRQFVSAWKRRYEKLARSYSDLYRHVVEMIDVDQANLPTFGTMDQQEIDFFAQCFGVLLLQRLQQALPDSSKKELIAVLDTEADVLGELMFELEFVVGDNEIWNQKIDNREDFSEAVAVEMGQAPEVRQISDDESAWTPIEKRRVRRFDIVDEFGQLLNDQSIAGQDIEKNAARIVYTDRRSTIFAAPLRKERIVGFGPGWVTHEPGWAINELTFERKRLTPKIQTRADTGSWVSAQSESAESDAPLVRSQPVTRPNGSVQQVRDLLDPPDVVRHLRLARRRRRVTVDSASTRFQTARQDLENQNQIRFDRPPLGGTPKSVAPKTIDPPEIDSPTPDREWNESQRLWARILASSNGSTMFGEENAESDDNASFGHSEKEQKRKQAEVIAAGQKSLLIQLMTSPRAKSTIDDEIKNRISDSTCDLLLSALVPETDNRPKAPLDENADTKKKDQIEK